MTWGAFAIAMRNSIAQRGSQAGRRAPQTANQTVGGTRSASSQTKQAVEEGSTTSTKVAASQRTTKKFMPDEWDFMVLDVCFSAKM